MIFTVITFFQKFALVLFMTIIQATVGSFVVFLTLTDCVGPSHPTYLCDRLLGYVTGRNNDAPQEETDSSRKLAREETDMTSTRTGKNDELEPSVY